MIFEAPRQGSEPHYAAAPAGTRRLLRSVPGKSAPSIDDVVRANTSVLDVDALGDLAVTAAANGRRLLDDAEILLKRGRWPTAYSLAVLAFEEAGKSWLCIIATRCRM